MKTQYILAATLIVLALAIAGVSAFGISSPYWKENPMIIQPGEIKEVSFSLQNMVGTKDVSIRAALVDGQNIAILSDASTDYLVKAGTADTTVNMRVVIPATEAIGTKHTITLTFSTITSGAGAGVSIGSSIEKSFEVIVGKEIKPIIETWMGIAGAVIVIVVLALLLKKKSKKKARRR